MSGPPAPPGEQAELAPAAVVETHSAVVVFVGDRAYKVKKSVDLGFLDFTTIDARREACEREVALNRRLSPDVYLGVSTVHDPDGTICDHMVTMRRMPDGRRLSACLDRSEDVIPALREIARQLTDLHATPSRTDRSGVGTSASVRSLWTGGFEQISPHLGTTLDLSVEQSIERLALRYLDGRAVLFDERIAAGQVCDGHGDLQAGDIFLLDDGPRILDCLEFDDDLRWGDVLLDAAFLAMDLERLGHPALASRFLADYRELSGRSWPSSLAHHYLAYRAFVRAKVAVLRGAQTGGSALGAQELQRQCLSHLDAGRVRLVVVGGVPGSGKSTLAAALGAASDSVVLRTDEIRRSMPDTGDRYGSVAIDETYRRMLLDAEQHLVRGEHVVLDATWSDDAHRDLARLTADRSAADVIEIRCTAPIEVCRSRISRRRAEGTDVSEAEPELATEMAGRFAPWPQASSLSTDRVVADVLDDALALCRWQHPFQAI